MCSNYSETLPDFRAGIEFRNDREMITMIAPCRSKNAFQKHDQIAQITIIAYDLTYCEDFSSEIAVTEFPYGD
jgi:hypothetical protein